MWRKRKASPASSDSTENSRKKRWKETYVISSSDDENENENDRSSLGEDEWYINCILDETKTHYLIDWEGPWSPTWEPKQNASEAAVGVWEEKKQKEKRRSDRGSRVTDTSPARSSFSRLEIRISSSSDPEAGIDETESPHHDGRLDSPLFVPLHQESISGHPGDQARSAEVLSQRSHTPLASQELRLSQPDITKDANPQASCSAAAPYAPVGVFQYISRSSIPSQYRLPDENTEPSSPTGSEGPRISAIQATQTPSSLLAGNRSRQINEIAETPPGPPGISESQRTLITTNGKDSDLQPLKTSISQRSSYCNLISQLSSSVLCPTACRIGSVPESTHSLHRSQQTTEYQSASVGRDIPTVETPLVIMEDRASDRETPSLAEAMEKYSQFEGSTPREKLRNVYAQLRAKPNTETPLNVDASATPSSAGDIEPVPLSFPETTAPLSVRVDREPGSYNSHIEGGLHSSNLQATEMGPPQQPTLETIQPSALTVGHQEQTLPGSVELGPSEFAVPLPMDSRVKDDYERILRDEAQNIGEYVNTQTSLAEPSRPEHERLASRMHGLLKQLSNVSTHPDLNIVEHIKHSDSDLAKEAAWAEYSSAKFLFLGYLVNMAGNHDMHLVIMVHGAKTSKTVERFLMGKGLSYTRARQEMGAGTNLEVSMAKGSLSFGIQSTLDDGIMETYKVPAAIIALDRSFNAKCPSVEHMRTTYARHGNLLPVVRLLVSNSSEHVELCFASSPEPERLRSIIQYTVRLRNVVGDLQDNALGVQEDSEEIISCLLSDNLNAHWTLPSIEPLNLVSSDELEAGMRILLTQSGATSSSDPQIQKRLFVEDGAEQASKRQRMHISQDTSQFTDTSKESTMFPSQTLDNDLHALETHLMQLRTSHANELEMLRKTLADTQSRLQEREGALSMLQHRYEARTTELHKLRQERDRLAEGKVSSEQRLEKQKEEIGKLKDERTQLRHELEKAREALKAGGGSTADVEAAQEEIRRLTKDNASLERKAEYEAKQAEYTREQYQTASNVAAQSGNELRQLKEENESLRRKVVGDASRLREINLKHDEARHLSRVKELEALLASREDLLRRKEDEVRDLRKNRPSTRSTSTQPRSPKWNAANSRPTSPGINNNNGSGISGRGSGLRFSSEMPL
ncbi:uncharacterized protein ACLA_001780 [Aspergillus clavatus NRRL 1]|uniref:HDA1 complex subunit n=1 Tax=Aspergillus clavatus (strain ATCC 1007 / CBS 513.65 / DSM 816 / NCTC 3887 / NRRL 1 / QM 1276 / 107) TaxID=344612 RepID=A1C4Z9_ASPCL|nr:uncharacterized protein ACLA_001780 [Aspergillus clavatus NRRL 1]EAW14767.1 hypothetical protein ACLA_001780 [Aspergillus clavatus NRRL 1]